MPQIPFYNPWAEPIFSGPAKPPAPVGMWDQFVNFLNAAPPRMPTMEDRTPGLDRPPQRGMIDELGTALMVPQSPLDFGLMALGGPFGKAAKTGAVALGGALESDPAEAGIGAIKSVGGGVKKAFSSLNELISAAQQQPLYVRWSRGPKYDMVPGAASKDYISGQSHDGLSAVELVKDLSLDQSLKAINDYSFLQMKDNKIKPHIYSGKKVGVDSDGSPSIRPDQFLGTLSDDLVKFMGEPSNIKRLSLMDRIDQNRRALDFYKKNPPDYIPVWTEDTLKTLEKQLLDLGGPVKIPAP